MVAIVVEILERVELIVVIWAVITLIILGMFGMAKDMNFFSIMTIILRRRIWKNLSLGLGIEAKKK